MAVVPVTTPNDTSEPQLLEMSPEQAEETAAKLRELETDMLLRRQEHARGFICCGLVISKEKYSLPEHLRVWYVLFFMIYLLFYIIGIGACLCVQDNMATHSHKVLFISLIKMFLLLLYVDRREMTLA